METSNKCRDGGMVDTLALGASTRKGVWVRVPLSVQNWQVALEVEKSGLLTR